MSISTVRQATKTAKSAVAYVENLPTEESELQALVDSLQEGAFLYVINEGSTGYVTSLGSGYTPYAYWRPSLVTPLQDRIVIPLGTRLAVNGQLFISTQEVTLKLSDYFNLSDLAGRDVYYYGCIPADGTSPEFVLSLNSTVPEGYTAETSRKMGGFHCLCADVGTIAGHTLSGYTAGQILPCSVWDLLHLPVSNPEGMVWVEGVNKWVDIYLPSWDGSKFVSIYGGIIADGASSPAFHGEGFAEKAPLSKKILASRDEFIYFAKGSNENTPIKGAADPNTTGGHVDSAGRRMISNYGIEDCAGALWQWGRDTFENTPNSTYNASNFYLGGYSWNNHSIYNASYDSQTYGSAWGLLRRALLGGSWGHGAYCGSRCVLCDYFPSCGDGLCAGRLVSDSKSIGF